MKTIEEKAKAYDEAIIKIKALFNNANKNGETLGVWFNDFANIIPELKESEDEVMRKWLIDYLNNRVLNLPPGAEKEAVSKSIPWLEKQGSQNLANSAKTCKDEQKPTDKAEQKFEIGDLITNGILVGKIDEIHKWGYHAFFGDYYADVPDVENWHKWTIQDAKAGDVLYSPCYKLLWIYKDGKTCHVGSNLNYNSGSIVINKPVCIPTDAIPATKKQQYLLFSKMYEAGYEWDAEKKESKKIEQKPIEENKGNNGGISPNSEWSEEDENRFNNLIFLVECSKEGEATKQGFIKFINRLKSLRPRNRWKPSEEQLRILELAIDYWKPEDYKTTRILYRLWEQLKKLREE